MIRFLLYECAIGHNKLKASGNSALISTIQNKHGESVKEVLLFDYFLYSKEYTTMERNKNELYEHMRKYFLQISPVKHGYQLSAHVKNKMNWMNFFGNIFSDDHDGNLGNGDSRQDVGGATLNGQGETWESKFDCTRKPTKSTY
ncbi:hypothetical protein PCYB_003080 [Plasmodium cynomolgi strain B]|uniref:Uncharacterized protein n=1 Tax=Plasmodium cynomolgi (strain B) TaxID=1120755 RepID=K6UZY4_PLACD|nr:hypothetical protein PCYB_003080 [Plasmodium cynomolgi strain B]GAB69559.1 hypothetical protein PCYB_003080 [Plasmodium cynomolgi strain B]